MADENPENEQVRRKSERDLGAVAGGGRPNGMLSAFATGAARARNGISRSDDAQLKTPQTLAFFCPAR